jgi:hypothetical protein
MLVPESEWIGRAFADLKLEEISPLINLGSATEKFRTSVQPHINKNIIAPLEDRGVSIIHSDLFDGDGVDIAGSIYDEAVFARLAGENPKSVLCSNMFEHVSNRRQLAESLSRMLPDNGYLIVTVPHSFPYHPDPIDSYFRPGLDDLKALLPEFEFISGDIVDCGTLIGRYRSSSQFMVAQILGSFVPFPPKRWIRNVHHWMWLLRQYKAACGVFRKTSNADIKPEKSQSPIRESIRSSA